MSILPVPDLAIKNILQLTPEILAGMGVSLLILDLDNTLAPYSGKAPDKPVMDWKRKLEAQGVVLFIVSNTRTDRARRYAELMDVPWINRAGKPSKRGIIKAMSVCGKTACETAVAGDQIYTDILAAKLSGTKAIAVRPIMLNNIFFFIRYLAELPFRLPAKRLREN